MHKAGKFIGLMALSAGATLGALTIRKFAKFAHHMGIFSKGNQYEYSIEATAPSFDPALAGKRIVFLGSSITYGMAARGNSFVDYLEKTCGIFAIKEAVSGTTLAVDPEGKGNSYVERMKELDPDMKIDAFMCQLSTNDARQGRPVGLIAEGKDIDSFDVTTTTGALEYIIAYVRKTWGCPIFFYTSQRFDNEDYDDLVKRLYELKDKWDFEILDLWNDEEFNAITPEEHSLYMANEVHPTRAGYKLWWTPEFKEFFEEQLG